MDEPPGAARARSLLAAYAAGDLPSVVDHFTEDVVYHERVYGTMVGRETVRKWIVPVMEKYREIYGVYEWHTIEDDTVEGYHVLVGGGFGPDAALARELFRDVKANDCPVVVERMLKAYLAHRSSGEETFHAFTRRHDDAALGALFAECRP